MLGLNIDSDFVREILRGEILRPEEARAIMKIAYLAAEIDLEEDLEESATLNDLAELVWAAAEIPPEPIPIVSPLPLPIDIEERMRIARSLTGMLHSQGARELAYVYGYLLSASDLALRRVESTFVDELQQLLGISDDRASDLAARSVEASIPEEHGASRHEHAH
jgi:hypothetical protein